MSDEEKQIMNKMIYCNLIKGEEAIKFNRHIIEMLEEIERLHSIIKEVREYIKENNFHCKNQVEQEQYDKELLEILDKENKGE